MGASGLFLAKCASNSAFAWPGAESSSRKRRTRLRRRRLSVTEWLDMMPRTYFPDFGFASLAHTKAHDRTRTSSASSGSKASHRSRKAMVAASWSSNVWNSTCSLAMRIACAYVKGVLTTKRGSPMNDLLDARRGYRRRSAAQAKTTSLSSMRWSPVHTRGITVPGSAIPPPRRATAYQSSIRLIGRLWVWVASSS